MESGNIPRNETEWDILLEIEQELNKWIHEQKKPGSSSHFFPTEEWIIWQQKVISRIYIYLGEVIYNREKAIIQYEGMREENYIQEIHTIWEIFQSILHLNKQMNQKYLIPTKRFDLGSYNTNNGVQKQKNINNSVSKSGKWEILRIQFLRTIEHGIDELKKLVKCIEMDECMDSISSLKC